MLRSLNMQQNAQTWMGVYTKSMGVRFGQISKNYICTQIPHSFTLEIHHIRQINELLNHPELPSSFVNMKDLMI